MTESEFNTFVRNLLRSGSRKWKPTSNARNRNRVPYVGDNKRRKWQVKCDTCGGLFNNEDIQIHHLIPLGELTTWDDFIKKLFCDSHLLSPQCKTCHAAISKKENEERLERKKDLKSINVEAATSKKRKTKKIVMEE